MGLSDKLQPILKEYKEYFPKHWKDEKYKWVAIQHFKKHWDIDAPDFGEMFNQATDKTENLLVAGYAYPRGMISVFADVDQEATRQMFQDLYDETQDLAVRVERFEAVAEELRAKYDDGSWKNHYQNTSAISTYLWLMFPDKYYMYRYGIAKDVATVLETTYQPKKTTSAESMIGGFAMYDEICEAIKNDDELCSMITAAIDEECWPDTQFHTATIDVGFFISRFYLEEKKKEKEEKEWFPQEYSPGLSVDEWVELLQDSSVFTSNALQIVKRLKDYGGQATCKQLSIKYGETPNFYNAGSTGLAQRVVEETHCPILQVDTENSKWWPVLYTGKHADDDMEGQYVWRLRPELSDALDKVDLSDVPLYKDVAPAIWKISHGAIPEEKRSLFREQNVAVVHGTTRPKGVSKVAQGQSFTDAIKKDDYFYLCYGNRIQLFGQFLTDAAEPCSEMDEIGEGWYERKYRVIVESKDLTPYTEVKKWWTPNDNSTCICVSEDEKTLFEELILKPYFDMTIADLYGDVTHGYWWLTANPKIWSFSDIKIGEEQSYTLYNENGHKRRIFQNFLDAKVGDIVIGYEANPVKKIVALGRITQANDGQNIYFEKTEGLAVPIEYAALKECPELSKMEFFVQQNGSLFKLTKGEFDFIMDMIREENPIKRTSAPITKYTKEDFLKEVYMTSERYEVLKELLLNKMNVILQGAPGVGKTFSATRLAYSIMEEMDDSRIELIQFHQNYSYEDFIMGWRPDGDTFKLTDGVFYRFCKKAENDPDNEYFFIIDEINRGNMSKIFGELLMLIEKDYRTKKATLAYNGMPFSIPDNLYLIGMMNTADRSLAMIDYALRRRFSFFEMEPALSSDGFRNYQAGFANETFDALIEQVKALNKTIKDDPSLGKGFMIGHSYFCGREPGQCSNGWMRSVVEFEIIPMLSEYWFDEPNRLQEWENRLTGVFDDE